MRSKQKRRLTKSNANRVLTGSIGGLAVFFGINANYLRIGFLIVTALTHFFPGILIYILMIIIMPADPEQFDFRSFFSNFGATSQQDTHKSTNKDRKVIHDVDEHDD